jgi:hypothetical protein
VTRARVVNAVIAGCRYTDIYSVVIAKGALSMLPDFCAAIMTSDALF